MAAIAPSILSADFARLGEHVREVEAARYAPPGGDGRSRAELRSDVRAVADVVADQVPARRRRLARWFPASGIAALTGAARSAEAAGGNAGRRISEQVSEEVRRIVGPGRRR